MTVVEAEDVDVDEAGVTAAEIVAEAVVVASEEAAGGTMTALQGDIILQEGALEVHHAVMEGVDLGPVPVRQDTVLPLEEVIDRLLQDVKDQIHRHIDAVDPLAATARLSDRLVRDLHQDDIESSDAVHAHRLTQGLVRLLVEGVIRLLSPVWR